MCGRAVACEKAAGLLHSSKKVMPFQWIGSEEGGICI